MSELSFTDVAKSLIGLALDEAKKLVASNKLRIMETGGEVLMGTMDFCEDRINVAVENGVVKDAWTG